MSVSGTLLGPLTTTWTMPSSCSLLYTAASATSNAIAYRGQSCNLDGYILDNSQCWPPRKAGVADLDPAFHGWGFYSPGIACPAGYATACSAVWQQRPEWDIQFSLFTSETAIGCCPTGYSCTNWNGEGNSCYAVPTETVLSTASCGTDGSFSAEGPYTWPATASVELPGNISATIGTLWAPMFQLNFRSTDITTASTGSSSPSTASSTSSSAPESTSAGAGSSGATLSKGAIAGIAVGAAIGGALLIAGAFVVLRRYRRRRAANETAYHGVSAHDKHPHNTMVPQEMPAGGVPVELPAEGRH